jgi:AraC-like DNA-binding protein
MTYLTRWRMLRATRLLKNEVRMETIAEQLGNESEAAFCRDSLAKLNSTDSFL